MKKLRERFGLKRFVLAWIFLFTLGCLAVIGGKHSEVNEKDINSDDFLTNMYSYEKSGNFYKMVGEDPRIIFDLSSLDSEKIYGVKIVFAEEIDMSLVQVFWGKESAHFNEGNSQWFGNGFSKEIYVRTPTQVKFVRLDIDGDFSIDSYYILTEGNIININFVYYFLIFIFSLFFATLIAVSKTAKVYCDKILAIFNELISIIKSKKTIRLIVMLTVETIVLLIIYYICIYYMWIYYINIYSLLLLIGVAYLVTISAYFIKQDDKYFCVYYFIIVMLVGTLNVIISPQAAGISWDDQIHYTLAADMSWGMKGEISQADMEVKNRCEKVMVDRYFYTLQGRYDYEQSLNQLHNDTKLLVPLNDSLGMARVSYIPSAIGIAVGRGLGLSFSHTFMFGKWMNLLCYAVILSYSVYLLRRRGYIIASFIGLIPTSIFMASEYSYDWWIISLTILGYSIFINSIEIHEKVSVRCIIKVMVILTIAMLPKAVYFPLMLPLMFFASDKYENAKKSRFIIALAIIILLSSFGIPFISNTGGYSDYRGGSDVNSSEQIAFILSEPWYYTQILVKFLWNYINLDEARDYLTYLSYYGHAGYFSVCLLLLCIGAVLDNSLQEKSLADWKKVKIGSMIVSVILTLVLIATALYVSFTPVRLDTINGVQPRYILPILFPFMYYIFKMDIDISCEIKKKFYVVGCLLFALVFLNGLNTLVVCFY